MDRSADKLVIVGLAKRSRTGVQAVGCALFLLLLALSGEAAKWSRRYINSLPGSAFASVEVTSDGRKVRHLPHHDHAGELDETHLLSALGRIHQVKWLSARNKEAALQHLRDHMREHKQAQLFKGGARFPVDLNSASIDELMTIPFIKIPSPQRERGCG